MQKVEIGRNSGTVFLCTYSIYRTWRLKNAVQQYEQIKVQLRCHMNLKAVFCHIYAESSRNSEQKRIALVRKANLVHIILAIKPRFGYICQQNTQKNPSKSTCFGGGSTREIFPGLPWVKHGLAMGSPRVRKNPGFLQDLGFEDTKPRFPKPNHGLPRLDHGSTTGKLSDPRFSPSKSIKFR